MNRKLKNINELKDMGFSLQESTEAVIELKLEEMMEKKGMSSIDICHRSGVSRQTMNAVVKGKMKPGLDFALKVAKILKVSVEELFELTESAWEEIAKTKDDKTLFLDRVELEIIDGVEKRKREQNGFIYVDMLTNDSLSSEEYEQKWQEYKKEQKSSKTNKILKADFKVFYDERYVKLVKKSNGMMNNIIYQE